MAAAEFQQAAALYVEIGSVPDVALARLHAGRRLLARGRASEAKAELKQSDKPAPLSTLFLGGGAYTFQRFMQHTYPGCAVDVAEIDPAVTRAKVVDPASAVTDSKEGVYRTLAAALEDAKPDDVILLKKSGPLEVAPLRLDKADGRVTLLARIQ